MKTNDCVEIESLLYLKDDELNQAESKRLRIHLEHCESCRVVREDVLKIAGILSTDPLLEKTGLKVLSRSQTPMDRLTRAARISGIAATLFITLFLGEQMHSVRKITKLEARLAAVAGDPWDKPISFQTNSTSEKVYPFGLKTVSDWVKLQSPGREPIKPETLESLHNRHPFRNTAFILKTH